MIQLVTNMENGETASKNLSKVDGFSLEMNSVSPAHPQPQTSVGPTCVAYAVGKFENAHISIFQVSVFLHERIIYYMVTKWYCCKQLVIVLHFVF